MAYSLGYMCAIGAAGIEVKTASWPFGPDLDQAAENAIAGRSQGYMASFPLDVLHGMTDRKVSPFSVSSRLAPVAGAMYRTGDLDMKYRLGAALGGETTATAVESMVTPVMRAALRGNLPSHLRAGRVKVPLSADFLASLAGNIVGESAGVGGTHMGLYLADAI